MSKKKYSQNRNSKQIIGNNLSYDNYIEKIVSEPYIPLNALQNVNKTINITPLEYTGITTAVKFIQTEIENINNKAKQIRSFNRIGNSLKVKDYINMNFKQNINEQLKQEFRKMNVINPLKRHSISYRDHKISSQHTIRKASRDPTSPSIFPEHDNENSNLFGHSKHKIYPIFKSRLKRNNIYNGQSYFNNKATF